MQSENTSSRINLAISVDRMTDEMLAGQRIMAGFDGRELTPHLKDLISRLNIGGVILFSRNLDHPDQIKRLCTSIQDYASAEGRPPLFIAVDQEGGEVARLKPPFTRFPGNPGIKTETDAREFATITARELLSSGFNMNMAPVLDIAPRNINSIMAGRSFGSDPQLVSRLGCSVIEHLQKNGIMAVAKHFPGIGRTVLDSHLEMPDLDIDEATLESSDLVPFRAAMHLDVSAVMLSHIRYPQIDPQWPASMSTRIAGDMVRKKMGFNGLLITDDLDMGAIKNHLDIRACTRRILKAEIDIALICHEGPDTEKAFREILEYIKREAGGRAAVRRSVQRIMALKHRYLGQGIPPGV